MPQVQFELKVGDETINASARVPAEPLRPADLLPILQGFSNAIVAAASSGLSISCRAGCGACCRQPVPISETEAIYLAELIEQMPPQRKATILARFSYITNRLKETGLIDRLDMQSLATVEERRAVADEYFNLALACPFLEDESCGIHPHRPLSCREYLVTSPAEECAHPTADRVRMVPMPKKLSFVLFQFADGVGHAPVKFLPLTLLLEYTKPEQPRLPGTEMFENFFRRVTAT